MIALNLNNSITVGETTTTVRDALLGILGEYTPTTGQQKLNLHRLLNAADAAEANGGQMEITNELYDAMIGVTGFNLL